MTGDQLLIAGILVKHVLRQPLDEEEKHRLEEWRTRSDGHRVLTKQLLDMEWLYRQRKQLEEAPTAEMWAEIRQHIHGETLAEGARVGRVGWRRRGVAALAAVLLGSLAMVLFWSRGEHQRKSTALVAGPPVWRVQLTRGNGAVVVLDTVPKGQVIVREGGVELKKVDSNAYCYSWTGDRRGPLRHILALAQGVGICQVRWADGSQAWLNAGTRADYAVDLRSAEVQLTGEAYFTIAHSAAKPLTIGLPGGKTVRVLGTSFAVKDYGETAEQRVTLFKGKVQVLTDKKIVTLKPGQEALLLRNEPQVQETANSDDRLGWLRPQEKASQYFDWRDADVLYLLPEIARWYRLQLVNPENLRGERITGSFRRNLPVENLVQAINTIENGRVRVRLSADTIYVSPGDRGE